MTEASVCLDSFSLPQRLIAPWPEKTTRNIKAHQQHSDVKIRYSSLSYDADADVLDEPA